jgi:hypothetical protein
LNVLLHIGSPKAGSSFLQTLCARSRKVLARSGIHFPVGTAYDEDCMQAGRISAGNALHLAQFLHEDRWEDVRRWLESAIDAAGGKQCDRLLLSSEWLLGSLARDDRIKRLDELSRELGADGVQLLMVLRDPVGQFLSLYKHRAKSGNVPSIDRWAEVGYNLPERLRSIREQVEEHGQSLSVRAYGKEPGSLERLFFEGWLDVPVPQQHNGLLVNPSLPLSELILLRKLRTRNTDLVPFLYERLLEVEPSSKVEGREMLTFARRVATNTVAREASEWSRWNSMMPEAERYEVPSMGEPAGEEPRQLELSQAQVAAVMDMLGDAAAARMQWQLYWRSRLRPALARVKRALFPWHSRR